MRPHWQSGSDDAELEALQTDVMRFVAILGLCLAAIFSLVQQASVEPRPPLAVEREVQPVAVPEPTTVIEPEPQPLRAPQVAKTQPKAEPVKQASEPVEEVVSKKRLPPQPVTTPEQGFSLEFESAAALVSLLESQRLRLYARMADDKFWEADSRGRFTPAAAPSHFYQMDAATVPGHLLQSQLATSGEAATLWGVDLSGAIVEQITETTRSASGGTILILADGGVRLEGGA